MFLTIHKLENFITLKKDSLKVCVTVLMTYKEKYRRVKNCFKNQSCKTAPCILSGGSKCRELASGELLGGYRHWLKKVILKASWYLFERNKMRD